MVNQQAERVDFVSFLLNHQPMSLLNKATIQILTATILLTATAVSAENNAAGRAGQVAQGSGPIAKDGSAKAWSAIPWNLVSATNWMAAVPDAAKISSFSIPGTHDSGALHENWPGTAKCQDLSIGEQLDVGIRYLDIRLRAVDDSSLLVHHADVYQHMSFAEVLKQVTDFLSKNPTETVIMSVKQDKEALNCTKSFAKIFKESLRKIQMDGGSSYKDFWSVGGGYPTEPYIGDYIPAMGEKIRGKIVLIRRFSESGEKIGGIDATDWPDNAVGCVRAGPHVMVQDEYSLDYFSGRSKKLERFEKTMELAHQHRDAGDLYLNFSSGVSKGIVSSFALITYVSDYMNEQLDGRRGLLNTKPAPYGVIVMDFVTRSLADYAWRSNARATPPDK